ncbi:hypothetical protein BTO20_11350 [Mycobacterium dioxanotrophicus]|uniref:DUF4326 domain-containing protein n=1 Tax=Mycobacterium dioxanotrophicus TaxID=482462 RepID=A0A1Y0C1N9_9MYCO|nr:DUF4326 domain-containing protein [Mycobacterium dioxanotrophicus]ART69100.1 hypothetical protein BTO20_11350 [Mycobacterium dioxanotrophicus]
MPERIQRSRQRGWRKPEGAIYVGRPTKWGNPFTIEGALESGYASTREEAHRLVVVAFRSCIERGEESVWWFTGGASRFITIVESLEELRGHDLVCWCPPDRSCHASVLLELANA